MYIAAEARNHATRMFVTVFTTVRQLSYLEPDLYSPRLRNRSLSDQC
jgi:hypothetical protein